MENKSLIGIILAGSTPLDLIRPMIKEANEFDYFIYCPFLTKDQKDSLTARKIKFSTDFNFTKLNLPAFNVLLTFGLLPHRAHMKVIALCSMYRKLGGHVLDFQHGLFQWGINFSDNSIEQGFSQQSGISLPIKTLASEQLVWFGENGLGIPKAKLKSENNGFTLIATNTNWHVYAIEEKIKLSRIIYFHIKNNPQTKFIWKPHPAEYNRELTPVLDYFDFDKLNNLIVLSHGNKGETLEELASKCTNAIVTVGSSLIDLQIYNKPTAVFYCSSVSSLLSEFKKVNTFSSLSDLSLGFGDVFFDTLKPFDKNLFSKVVNEKSAKISYSDLLMNIMDDFNV